MPCPHREVVTRDLGIWNLPGLLLRGEGVGLEGHKWHWLLVGCPHCLYRDHKPVMGFTAWTLCSLDQSFLGPLSDRAIFGQITYY